MNSEKFRRIISFLLGAIMVLGAFPVTVFANEEQAEYCEKLIDEAVAGVETIIV